LLHNLLLLLPLAASTSQREAAILAKTARVLQHRSQLLLQLAN